MCQGSAIKRLEAIKRRKPLQLGNLLLLSKYTIRQTGKTQNTAKDLVIMDRPNATPDKRKWIFFPRANRYTVSREKNNNCISARPCDARNEKSGREIRIATDTNGRNTF